MIDSYTHQILPPHAPSNSPTPTPLLALPQNKATRMVCIEWERDATIVVPGLHAGEAVEIRSAA